MAMIRYDMDDSGLFLFFSSQLESGHNPGYEKPHLSYTVDHHA